LTSLILLFVRGNFCWPLNIQKLNLAAIFPFLFLHSGRLVQTRCHRFFVKFTQSQETDFVVFEDFHLLGIVPAVLHFTDVRAPEHKLTQAALSHAPSNYFCIIGDEK
jgi:hypothetical protein